MGLWGWKIIPIPIPMEIPIPTAALESRDHICGQMCEGERLCKGDTLSGATVRMGVRT